jgi:hypothetical protein
VPGNFAAGNDKSDMLMNSLISEYSIEGRDKKTNTPNGHYYIDKHGMETVSRAAMKQNLDDVKENGLDKLVADRFPSLWEKADVNKDGFVEVERAPMFVRTMVGEVEAGEGL